MAWRVAHSRLDKWLIALGTFLVLTFTSLSPIWLVLVAAGIGLIFYR